MKPFETFHVDSLEVACDGGLGALGHPRVYLHIEPEKGVIACPYCSRQFIYAPVAGRAASGH